jgi:hypothetical protein
MSNKNTNYHILKEGEFSKVVIGWGGGCSSRGYRKWRFIVWIRSRTLCLLPTSCWFLHHLHLKREDGGNKYPRIVGEQPSDYTTSHPKRYYSLCKR